jgi:hypothetical protein
MRRDEFMNAHEVRMSELEKACEDLNEILGSDPVEGFEDDILDPSLESERGIQDIQTKNSQDLDDLLKGLENL